MTRSAARAYLFDQPMSIASDLLGPLVADPDELYHFPVGLFGFPECHTFLLVGAERPGLYWLQSAEHSTLTFLAVDPFQFFSGYAVDLSTSDLRELDVASSSEVSILAIVTLPASRSERPTANLQGPVALNTRTRSAKQLVLEEGAYGTRCAFDLERANPAG